MRVPMPLKIQDQRAAEMAVRLLAGEDSSIVEELANRLLCHTECTPVSDGADDARVCEPVDHSGKRCIHLIRLHDCVADQPSFRAVTVEPPPVHDCLPRDAVASKARQSHVRGAGDNPFLARRQSHVSVRCGQYVVHHKKMLAPTANGKAVDRRDAGLFGRRPHRLVRRQIRTRQAAQPLVLKAQ
jgi:hypothetical protein